jgi:hypothetical protein
MKKKIVDPPPAKPMRELAPISARRKLLSPAARQSAAISPAAGGFRFAPAFGERRPLPALHRPMGAKVR